MSLSPKMIYQLLKLDDPKIFREKIAVDNLFSLQSNSRESDIYRRTGKTTNLIIDAISFALEKNKTILIYCRDYQNVRHVLNESKLILKKINNYYPIKFEEKIGSNQINFEELNSHFIVRSHLDTLWSEPKHDIVYSDK